MIGEELKRLMTWGERHRRLLSRILLAVAASLIVDAIGTTLMWNFECDIKGSDIHNYWDAFFFTTVQLVTVSSNEKNPLTNAGKTVDMGLEIWAIFVVTAIAGSFSSFFSTGDSS